MGSARISHPRELRLNRKQRLYVAGVAAGKSRRRAALDAGIYAARQSRDHGEAIGHKIRGEAANSLPSRLGSLVPRWPPSALLPGSTIAGVEQFDGVTRIPQFHRIFAGPVDSPGRKSAIKRP